MAILGPSLLLPRIHHPPRRCTKHACEPRHLVLRRALGEVAWAAVRYHHEESRRLLVSVRKWALRRRDFRIRFDEDEKLPSGSDEGMRQAHKPAVLDWGRAVAVEEARDVCVEEIVHELV